jgi:thioredoxin reductase
MKNTYEVIIIGGSYAGLSAAMALGRSNRNVLVIDSSMPCNRHTPHSHNFITQDGETPAAIAQKAKKQVMQYPTVSFLKGKATTAEKMEGGFTVGTEAGEIFTAKKLLFATGVADIMPNIGGFDDCWGISVVHCPYCHGYEVKGKKTAILANGEAAMHYATLIRQLSNDLTIFTNGPANFTEEQLNKLKHHDINIIEGKVAKLKHSKGYVEKIIMEDCTAYDFPVIYSRPDIKQHSDLPELLGCNIDAHGFIIVDEMQKTTVNGVYAAGDCTTGQRAVAVATASGMKAGAAINYALCAEAF